MKSADKFENNSAVYKKAHWAKVCDETGKCHLCPKHDIENYGKRPRPDKYKSKRKGKI